MRSSIDELWPACATLAPEALFKLAREAKSRAYAPYSGFHVGAACLSENNEIALGCNVENGSFGLSMCAERSALAASRVLGHVKTLAIAVAGDADGPCFPCGACRQVIFEWNPDMCVVVSTQNGVEIHRIADLLPFAFDLPGRRHDDGPF